MIDESAKEMLQTNPVLEGDSGSASLGTGFSSTACEFNCLFLCACSLREFSFKDCRQSRISRAEKAVAPHIAAFGWQLGPLPDQHVV